MDQKIGPDIDDIAKPTRVRRTRRSKFFVPAAAVVEPADLPQAYGRYHPRPAKSALEATKLEYEPPYESPALQIGQRAEHPEYDTGHALARPVDIEEKAA